MGASDVLVQPSMLIYSLDIMYSKLCQVRIALEPTLTKVTPSPVLSPLSFRIGITSSPLASIKIRRKTSTRLMPSRLIAVGPGNSSREGARTLTPAATPSTPLEGTAPLARTQATPPRGKSAKPLAVQSSAPPASPQAAPAASPFPRTASQLILLKGVISAGLAPLRNAPRDRLYHQAASARPSARAATRRWSSSATSCRITASEWPPTWPARSARAASGSAEAGASRGDC